MSENIARMIVDSVLATRSNAYTEGAAVEPVTLASYILARRLGVPANERPQFARGVALEFERCHAAGMRQEAEITAAVVLHIKTLWPGIYRANL